MKSSVFFALGLALTFSACVDNNASVEPYGVCAIPTTCSFSGACEALALSRPELDVAIASQLQLYVEFRNQMKVGTNAESGAANANDFYVLETATDYELDTGVGVPSVTTPTIGTVPADGVSVVKIYPVDSYIVGLLKVVVPPSSSAAPVYQILKAKVKARGRLVGGGEMETGEYVIPIKVCNGCFGGAPVCATGTPSFCPPNGVGQQPATVTCPP